MVNFDVGRVVLEKVIALLTADTDLAALFPGNSVKIETLPTDEDGLPLIFVGDMITKPVYPWLTECYNTSSDVTFDLVVYAEESKAQAVSIADQIIQVLIAQQLTETGYIFETAIAYLQRRDGLELMSDKGVFKTSLTFGVRAGGE